MPLGGEEPEWNADPDGEDHRGDRELDGRGEALPDLVRDLATAGDARPEVALQRVLHVIPVLDGNRTVEAVPLLVLLYELRCGALAEESAGRIPWQRPDPEEDQDRDADEDRNEKHQPADDVSKHCSVVRRLRVYLTTDLLRTQRTGTIRPQPALRSAS